MDKSANEWKLRSFLYVSEAKLASFIGQIDARTKRKSLEDLQFTLGVNFIAQGSVSGPIGRPSRNRGEAEAIAIVEEHIRQRPGDVGAVNSQAKWISGHVEMEWEPLPDGQTVLFCGYAGQVVVALQGSVQHLRGRVASGDRIGSYSSASTFRSAIRNGDASGSGDGPEDLGRDLAAAARRICVRPRPVRFLAEVHERGAVEGDSPRTRFVLATPLYVEYAYAAADFDMEVNFDDDDIDAAAEPELSRLSSGRLLHSRCRRQHRPGAPVRAPSSRRLEVGPALRDRAGVLAVAG